MLCKIFLLVLIATVVLLAISQIKLVRKYKALRDRNIKIQKYMADVFHELKTPLTAIKVLAESLLSQEESGIDIYREFMRDISFEADRENKIINDLMTLIKMGGEGNKPNNSEFSVNSLIEDITNLYHAGSIK